MRMMRRSTTCLRSRTVKRAKRMVMARLKKIIRFRIIIMVSLEKYRRNRLRRKVLKIGIIRSIELL